MLPQGVSQMRPRVVLDPTTRQKFTVFESFENQDKRNTYIPVNFSFIFNGHIPKGDIPSWIEFVKSTKDATGSMLAEFENKDLILNVKKCEELAFAIASELRRNTLPIERFNTEVGYVKAWRKNQGRPVYGGKINIIMPVHGRGDWVLKCLRSIIDAGGLTDNEHLLVVNDCSDKRTYETLDEFWEDDKNGIDNMSVIGNKKQMGYLYSVNKGIDSTKGGIIVLLNSDVLVTPGWIAKIRRAMGNEKVGAASLISNNMVNLSLPILYGSNYLRMNEILEATGREEYQDAVFPTGAMLAFRRDVFNKYGGCFDQDYYGEGYGEETDFLMWIKDKTEKKIVLIDTGYFYHSGGASHADRSEREKKGYKKFMSRWESKFTPLLTKAEQSKPMDYYYKLRDVFPNFSEKKICYYVHALELSGGFHVIANLVNGMIRRGIDARICTVNLADYSRGLVELLCEPILFKNEYDFIKRFHEDVFDDGILVANIWFTAPWVKEICDNHPNIEPMYYIQDYDAWFNFSKDKEQKVIDTYRMIERKVGNANWSAQMIMQNCPGSKIDVIPIGVDTRMFRPIDEWNEVKLNRGSDEKNPIKVLGFHRPVTPRRSADDLIQILYILKNRFGRKIEVGVFGDKLESTKDRMEQIKYYGRLKQSDLAMLLRDTDIFIDASKFQGFGLTNIEAMASGCTVLSSDNYGIREYGLDGENCRIFPTGNVVAAVDVATSLINDSRQRIDLAEKGLEKVRKDLDWEKITERMVGWIWPIRYGETKAE